VSLALRGKLTGSQAELMVCRPDVKFPFFLRVPSSDVDTYQQVFAFQEYALQVRTEPRVIIDAGANIGLASLYFANRFPAARIYAVEPDVANFRLLEKNVKPYPAVIPIHGALWKENTELDLIDPGLGHWGFMTKDRHDGGDAAVNVRAGVRGMTVDSLLDECGVERVDIVKIDIEGAEREVFEDPSKWLARVDALIVEVHDRSKPGCSGAVYGSTTDFEDRWELSGNVFLARRTGCVVKP